MALNRNNGAAVAAAQTQKGAAAAVPAIRQKAQPARADGRSRRALGDIGNTGVAADGKLPLNRPITRSFGAQLLAKAAVEANKAPKLRKSAAAPAAAAAKPPAVKPVKKATATAAVAPPPEKIVAETVTASSDEPKNQLASTSSSKKKTRGHVTTLTSVLTARSKAACALTERVQIIDEIDVADSGNQLAVVEYIDDIYKFYKEAEVEHLLVDYMGSQPEITPKMRAILADWLVEVHHQFKLMPETLYLTIHIVDRFLSLQAVPRRELQLVGVSALLIASKYEEIWAPEVSDFINIADNAYKREDILGMEKKILSFMKWQITVPTPYVFLVRFVKAANAAGNPGDREMEHMSFFFAEMGLMQYSFVMLPSSLIAASAVHAARCTLNRAPRWTAALQRHTGYAEEQLLDSSRSLVQSHASVPEGRVKMVYRKYANEKFAAVSLKPPATAMLDELKTKALPKA